MSYNLADLPMGERRALEEHKAELFEFWKANKDRSYGDAARISGRRRRRGRDGAPGPTSSWPAWSPSSTATW
ncbi:hypothetical protein [Pseudomonas sp. RIT411]|uniref:hypothetical protein n=1 Tax=Pseudomonas sp. RIT411 TaxID=2202160 RepID=UPI0021150257|nr:hypothetical protein [Pseudomonas sp. RIT 411]